uniref:Uncharacterized protein n=1 Tax=Anguilla anguilla TaxID=7936 RepID=A0A0E9U1M1_ANGAN
MCIELRLNKTGPTAFASKYEHLKLLPQQLKFPNQCPAKTAEITQHSKSEILNIAYAITLWKLG